MDQLTPTYLDDLRQLGIILLAYVAITSVIGLLVRWHKKQPLFKVPSIGKWIGDNFIIVPLILILGVQPILGRLGVPDWLSFVGFGIVAVVVLLFAFYKMQHNLSAQATVHGIENPDGREMPAVPPSRDETALGRKLLLALGLLVLIVAALVIALPTSPELMLDDKAQSAAGQTASGVRAMVVLLATLGLLAALAWLFAGRWPGKVCIRGGIEIEASPGEIWDALVFRAGEPHFRNIYSRIERLGEPGEVYHLHYLVFENCGSCGLPKHPEGSGLVNRLEVLEARRPEIYRTRSLPEGMDGMKGDASKWFDVEEETIRIDALPGGRSKVESESSVMRPKAWMAALLRFGNPIGENLLNLKAHLEGAADDSIYMTAQLRFEAARNAPRHCGCPAT